MLKIITASKSATEQAVVALARAYGITCITTKPRRSGAARRSYRVCLQHCAVEADATLVLGNRQPPYSSDIDAIWGEKPIRSLSVSNAMHFDPTGANTRKWLARWRTVHITGTASKQATMAFLKIVLKPAQMACD